jgi:hypothetical protein
MKPISVYSSELPPRAQVSCRTVPCICQKASLCHSAVQRYSHYGLRYVLDASVSWGMVMYLRSTLWACFTAFRTCIRILYIGDPVFVEFCFWGGLRSPHPYPYSVSAMGLAYWMWFRIPYSASVFRLVHCWAGLRSPHPCPYSVSAMGLTYWVYLCLAGTMVSDD